MSSVNSYTVEEVAKNDGKNGNRCWIIYKKSVYDCTDFLDQHPGGGQLILDLAGKDATKDFNEVGHSSDAMKNLKKLKIGEIGTTNSVQTEAPKKIGSDKEITLENKTTDGLKYFTIEDVALNNGKNGNPCWIIYKKSVYDCTSYLDQHPGGGQLILDLGGKDATKDFNDAGHSSDAMKDLKKLKIGEISSNVQTQQPTTKNNGSVRFSDSIGKSLQIEKSNCCLSKIFCGMC